MDVIEAVRQRRSIRGFKKEPVPRETIREILQESLRAPSAMNTQPWELTVVTGEPLDKIREENVQKLAETGVPFHFTYEGIYRRRQVDLAKQIFALMDIKREDKEKRARWLERGFRYFDAPAAIIVSMDRSLEEGTWALFDLGCLTQTICLVALQYGLGTCIEDQGVAFEEVIRKHTGLPESKKAVIGIAIGYPDWDFPANKLVSERESADELTTWVGF